LIFTTFTAKNCRKKICCKNATLRSNYATECNNYATNTSLIIRKLAVLLQSEIINHFKGLWKERTGKGKNMLKQLGINNRKDFEKNTNEFVACCGCSIMAGYNVYESSMQPYVVFAVEENDNTYYILEYRQENNGKDVLCEIAEWIANYLGKK
jgi:hypothetical protein